MNDFSVKASAGRKRIVDKNREKVYNILLLNCFFARPDPDSACRCRYTNYRTDDRRKEKENENEHENKHENEHENKNRNRQQKG